ncbi:hypothetical protein Vi05172_g8538 [Venturia inaequalis]|nr:hypothetical protein Vi05172_g8538 [Venturia inaequalis]
MRQAKSKQTAKSRQSKAEADARLEQTKAAAAALTRAYKFGNGFLATWLVTAAVGSGYEFGPHSRHRVDYVNTNEYVGMAQHLSAQSGLSIPLHVVNRLDNILFLRRQVRDLHVRIRQMNPLDPGVNSKSDAGHQAFIDTLARVRIELKSDTTTSETSIPTPASGTLGLEGLELSPKVSEKEDSSFWQAMEDDKVQARFALQDLFSTLKSLEQEALSLWEAFHNGRSESQLVIAATTTYMAMKLVTALELEFTELYENCDLGLLAQELHVEACKEQGQPNLQGFVIDFDHYTTAESYYIPHLWMATLLHSNWSQVVQDVQNKKAVSRSFDNDERKIFNSPASGRLNDEGKENKGRCEESLKFGYRTIHRVLSSLSIAKTIEKLYEDLYPAEMDPLIQMIAERHTQPLAFAFAMRLQEKITLTVRTESVPVCETARQKMNGVIDAKMKHLSLNEKDFEGANGIKIWKKLISISMQQLSPAEEKMADDLHLRSLTLRSTLV